MLEDGRQRRDFVRVRGCGAGERAGVEYLGERGRLALAAYAGSFLLGNPALPTMLAWFVGAAVVHDFVLFPLYALTDQVLRRLPVRIINHIRLPLLGAGLTFLMFLPGIIRHSEATHQAATSLSQQPYLGRWLWLVVTMFATSGAVYPICGIIARVRDR